MSTSNVKLKFNFDSCVSEYLRQHNWLDSFCQLHKGISHFPEVCSVTHHLNLPEPHPVLILKAPFTSRPGVYAVNTDHKPVSIKSI